MNFFNRFMYGRYGIDKLNVFLAVLLIVLTVVSVFLKDTPRYILQVFYTIGYVLFLFRYFSKNINKRRAENEKFQKITASGKKYFKFKYRQMTDRDFKYFKCPKCSATLRVPKRKGNITVTCPVCKNKFDKKI